MPERTGSPAYHWRHHTPYVARFCDEDDALRWIENRECLAAVGTMPQPGVTYRDEGHAHCASDRCPEAGHG